MHRLGTLKEENFSAQRKSLYLLKKVQFFKRINFSHPLEFFNQRTKFLCNKKEKVSYNYCKKKKTILQTNFLYLHKKIPILDLLYVVHNTNSSEAFYLIL